MLTQTERNAKIESLISENSAALNAPRIMDGNISSTQINRMGKRQFSEWQNNVSRGFEVRAELKELSKSNEQLTHEESEKSAAERAAKIASIRRYMKTIEDLGSMSHLPNGKFRKAYQKSWDIEVAKLQALGETV